MQWSENLSTGVDEIDEQHKELFKDINNAMISIIKSKNDLTKSEPLAELKKSFKKHFDEQENMMRLTKYPSYVQHQFLHQKLIKELDHFNEVLYMDSVNASISQINTFVMQWIVKHIAMQDKNFGKYYSEHKDDED